MNTYEIVFVVIVLLVFAIRLGYSYGKTAGLRRMPKRKLLTERLVKLMYNPFAQEWQWTKLNPLTRTWEWRRLATKEEVEKYQDITFPEFQGDLILNSVNEDEEEETYD